MGNLRQTRRSFLIQSGIIFSTLASPFPFSTIAKPNYMKDEKYFDVIIIGGSYAGLSAAMALGRAMRDVLVIDSGLPCNRQTPHSHNFITQDGEKPHEIAQKAKSQVLKYDTVEFHNGLAISSTKTDSGFIITTETGESFKAKKLLFATGVKDIMPSIDGFSECWGISVIHCPYCHGYEVRNEKTGILANGDFAFHYAQLINNWTKDLTIFTNGEAKFSPEQLDKITKNNIAIIEKEIDHLNHKDGKVRQIVFKDKSAFDLTAIYSRPKFEQHCKIPEALGCEMTEQGHIKVDMLQKTNIDNVFACGDSTSLMRSVSNAVSTGNLAGAMINNVMTGEEF
ncbi:NAD(P)/FAD-dependent oxidoreductase [Belliella marina]|uniref:NAD(P)/FAD-dependent oxidoreductase n=1 Tax=Belliella marina TaxID=1644146 RepID=A0ABW4VS36_9BACT